MKRNKRTVTVSSWLRLPVAATLEEKGGEASLLLEFGSNVRFRVPCCPHVADELRSTVEDDIPF